MTAPNPKTTLYVGGLDDAVTEAVLTAACIPFGEIKDVNIPFDNVSGKHKGFGFVTFMEKEDAADAMDNLHNAEIFGRVIRCNFAQPIRGGGAPGGGGGANRQPVWADADAWLEKQAEETEKAAAEGEPPPAKE